MADTAATSPRLSRSTSCPKSTIPPASGRHTHEQAARSRQIAIPLTPPAWSPVPVARGTPSAAVGQVVLGQVVGVVRVVGGERLGIVHTTCGADIVTGPADEGVAE